MTLSIGVLNDFFKSAGIVWIDSRGNPDNPSPSEPQKDEDRRIFDSNVSEGNSKDQNKKTQTQANPASHSSNPSYSFHSTGFFEAGNRSGTIPGFENFANTSAVIIVDNSFSMDVSDEWGNRFNQSKTAVRQIIKGFERRRRSRNPDNGRQNPKQES